MTNAPALTPVRRLSSMLSTESVRTQFQNALKEHADLFLASILDVYGSDSYLQKCDPGKVIQECLKAATLRLPLNKQLGFAYIVPYKDVPTFIVGYKGLIQLAVRTGCYKTINADVVYEGEMRDTDKLTGVIDLSGQRAGDTVAGYFAHFETTNGFRKTMFMTVEDMVRYAKKYSKSYNSSSSPWKSEPDAMGIKTMLRILLGKYGIMSVEFAAAISKDGDLSNEGQLGEVIDIQAERYQEKTLDACTDEQFSELAKEWEPLVRGGKKKAGAIIATAKTSMILTDEQQMQIAAWEEEGE